jgi:DNA invertase Pin-like site-specific DNA recombinase
VIIAKLDRLTRSVKDLAELLERFQRRGVSLVSVAESLDTGSAAGDLPCRSRESPSILK